MKHKLNYLSILLCLLVSLHVSAQQQMRFISRQEALTLVKGSFSGQDVDYYISDADLNCEISNKNDFTGPNFGKWKFFVDAEPMKGWEHDCYIVEVQKSVGSLQSPAVIKTKLRMPPNEKFTPIDVRNRYGVNALLKPNVRKENLSNIEKLAAQRTFAVILSGGVNMMSNYERYWNDCSFVYQTLVNKYGVPKNNISVIMSDGTNPEDDMFTTEFDYKSSPLDLDNDGIADIQYAATRNNVKNVLSSLSTKMNKNDHLFFYVIDHGGTIDYISQSYICLWDGERLYDYELAQWLMPLTQKSINVNTVLGQCFSGGFIDDLSTVGCVVSTASKGSEPSYCCYDIPYDEFVYQWTSAINEKDAFGRIIVSDCDNNNRVTIDEAFKYAKQNDRENSENPQYNSNPISIGEDLAFNNIPKPVDLYIKDNEEDTGKEPNLSSEVFWNSPDIWVRNQDDSIKQHENPYYSSDHLSCMVYVRVYNRGKEDFNGKNKWLHVYWAKASTGLTTKAWKGRELYNNQHVTGAHLRASAIPFIPAGGYADVKVGWALPSDLVSDVEGNGTEKHHFCLLARILDTFVDDSYDPNVTTFDIKGSNDIAQRNVSVISKEDVLKETTVFVRNVFGNARKYSLEIRPCDVLDEQLFEKATLRLEMSDAIYEAWNRGGNKSNSIDYKPSVDPRIVKFTSRNSIVKDVFLNGDEFDKVRIKLDFHEYASRLDEKYTFDLIQRDENGKIIGGETFIVEVPILASETIEITHKNIGEGRHELSSNLSDKDYSVEWLDGNNNKIGEGARITVSTNKSNYKFSAIAISKEGELSKGEITLEDYNAIKTIYPDAVKKYMYVELFGPVTNVDAELNIYSIMQGTSPIITTKLSEGIQKIHIDTSALTNGVYVFNYVVDGKIVDSKKIIME